MTPIEKARAALKQEQSRKAEFYEGAAYALKLAEAAQVGEDESEDESEDERPKTNGDRVRASPSWRSHTVPAESPQTAAIQAAVCQIPPVRRRFHCCKRVQTAPTGRLCLGRRTPHAQAALPGF